MQLQLKKYDVPDYGARATAALKDHKWADALVAMQGVRAHSQSQKQGTLQRCNPPPPPRHPPPPAPDCFTSRRFLIDYLSSNPKP